MVPFEEEEEDFLPEDDEDTADEAEPTAKPMSNSDMLGMALVALAPALLGGAMGGKKGALAGAASGSSAAGGALKSQADLAQKLDAAKTKRDQDLKDFKTKEDYKDELRKDNKPTKVPARQPYQDKPGGPTKLGVIGDDGKLIKSPNDEIVSYPKPEKDPTPPSLQQTSFFDKDGNPLAFNPKTNTFEPVKVPGGIVNPEADQKKVEKFGDDVGPIADIFSAINSVEDSLKFKLEDFDPKKGSAKGKTVDLPGVSVPGVGRVDGYDLDARTLRSRIGKVFNVELKTRSGATVTDTELNRLKEEFGNGKFNTETELLGALAEYKVAAARALANAEAKYPSDIVKLYGERGGFTSARLKPTEDPKKKTPQKVPLSPEFSAALEWAKDPKNINDKHWPEVVAKLKKAGVIISEQQTAGE